MLGPWHSSEAWQATGREYGEAAKLASVIDLHRRAVFVLGASVSRVKK